MDFTLRQLRAFASVARLGSFTRAAMLLHVSQPALTVQIRQLEQALGVRLLDRTSRSVAMTRVGREFLPALQRILGEIDALTADARELSEQRRGTVTIAALPSISSVVLPTTIATFKTRHPAITVRFREAVTQRVLTLVKAGEVDLGIASVAKADGELKITPLIADLMCVAFPPGHPLERKTAIALEDLTRFPLILPGAETSVRGLVDRAFESIGRVVLPAYEADIMATAIGLVRAGLGVAILPSSVALAGGPLTGLRVRRIRHEGLVRRIGIVEKAGRSLSPAAEQFVRVMREVCKNHRVRDSLRAPAPAGPAPAGVEAAPRGGGVRRLRAAHVRGAPPAAGGTALSP